MGFVLGVGVGLIIILIFRKQLLQGRKAMISFIRGLFSKSED